jgi:hypothetical protein
MATSDIMREAQRPLAEFAYQLKEKYRQTRGRTKKEFMTDYDLGEIQLSSVFENLFVHTRKKLGKPVTKISEDSRDFSNNGDFKTTVLLRDGDKRRFVVNSVHSKIGTIYCTGWNWMTNKVNFFAVGCPKDGFPKCGIKILVDPITGERTKGWYNNNCAYDSWEEMCSVD